VSPAKSFYTRKAKIGQWTVDGGVKMNEDNKSDPYSIFLNELKNSENFLENIKNENVFDLNYIPDKIYVRKEMKVVASNIAEYATTGIPINMIIYGNKGSGKTLTVLSLLNAGKKLGKLDYFYVKATEYPTSFRIFGAIAGKPMHGYNLDEVKDEALKKIKGRYVVVIDEANALSDDTILYVLSRDTKAQIILLTQKTLWFNSISDSVKSSLMPNHIYFPPYDAVELKTILKMRAEEGLKSYSEEGISLMSTLIYKEYSSDARIGIRGLYHVGKKNDWSEEFIKESLEKSSKEVNYYIVESLDDYRILILAALLKGKSTNKAYTILYDYMQNIYGLPIIKKSQYFNIIHELGNLGLFDIIKVKKGKYYTLEIQFLIDTKLITEEFEKRFGVVLNNKSNGS